MADRFGQNPFEINSYNPDHARELIRGSVAVIAIAAFTAVVIFYLWFAARSADPKWSQVKEATQSILPAVTSVLGTVLGFYFGSQKS